MDRYYVVQTQPQRESLAVKEMQNQGFRTFFPVIQHLPRTQNGRTLNARRAPLFPKYVFVQLDLDYDPWRSINGTRGVTRLMCMDEDRPSAMPDLAMSRLLAAGELILEDAAGLPFNVNDTVEFTEGPMRGLKGVVNMCSMERVTLLLSMLGGPVTVRTSPKVLRYVPGELIDA